MSELDLPKKSITQSELRKIIEGCSDPTLCIKAKFCKEKWYLGALIKDFGRDTNKAHTREQLLKAGNNSNCLRAFPEHRIASSLLHETNPRRALIKERLKKKINKNEKSRKTNIRK